MNSFFGLHAAAMGVLAVISSCVSESPMHALGVFIALCLVWTFVSVTYVAAHDHRVLIRTLGSKEARLQDGSFFVCLPEYVVRDSAQFGPWKEARRLPLVGQVRSIDVPMVLVAVENGLYCVRVNTKVVGTVEAYSVEEIRQSSIAIENRCHDMIAHALRKAVYDKPLEEALVVIQNMFLKDAAGIAEVLSTPMFRPTQLMLDANENVTPADAMTQKAMELIQQGKQEAMKRANIEKAMDTEEQKVKLQKIGLQATRDELMLQQEIYGKEGASIIEAAKHAKALYLFSGGGQGLAGAAGFSLVPP